MLDEVERLKAAYAKRIEDGRKIEVFTSMPEYQWFVEHVLQPTVDEYTDRIMGGEIKDEKEEWLLKGMVRGIRLFIDAPETFNKSAEEARRKAKELGGTKNE